MRTVLLYMTLLVLCPLLLVGNAALWEVPEVVLLEFDYVPSFVAPFVTADLAS